MSFRDRDDAGRQLAEALAHLRADDPVVVGLPRGGVPVASRVAGALGAPLDVVLVRKLGVPDHEELAMGAIGEDGVIVLNDEVIFQAGISGATLADVERRERFELERRRRLYRSTRERVPLEGRTVVVVDDGLATGATARAALQVVRAHGARRVVLAVPVAPPSTVAELADVADEIVTVETPDPFYAVGLWYVTFPQTTDDEVAELLSNAAGVAADQ